MTGIAENRRKAAASSLQDVVNSFKFNVAESDRSLTGKQLVELLAKNFAVLDPDGNGISRDELVDALSKPNQFTPDEYLMIEKLMQYFNTVANLADDQEAKETVITMVDMEVMEQFLLHSDMSLEQLDSWISLGTPADE